MKKCLEVICTIMLLMLLLVGCNSDQNENIQQKIDDETEYNEVKDKIKNKNLSSVIVTLQTGDDYELYNIENDYSLKKIDSYKNIIDLKYDYKKEVYVGIVKNSDNEKSPNSSNKLLIQNKDKLNELKEAYYYSDIKMSKDSSKLLYRSFKDESHTVPEGMQIYDIENMKKVNINSNVLVSGNIYEWLDNDTLLYYGVIPDVNNSSKIYKYNLKSNREEVYFDRIDEYCKYFFPVQNKGVIVLENSLDDCKLYYYDFQTCTKHLLSDLIDEMIAVKADFNRNKIYFICKINNQDNYYLYQIDLDNLNLLRVNYDFPHNVYADGGLAIDNNGTLFFVGYDDDVTKKDIYTFNSDTNTINLISNESGNYRIFNSNK